MTDMVEQPSTFHFGGQRPGPHLLITAGVHGDEFESIVAVQKLIELFDNKDPNIAGLRGQITLVPVVNESAFVSGRRCGEDGLDLARACPGRADGTPTEQTAHHLSQLINSVDYYIDLHTGGTELAVFPLAGYTMHANPVILIEQRAMAYTFNLSLVWGTSADLEGRSLSVARDAGVPAIYCEYLGSASCDANGVDSYVSGCLNVMGYLAMVDREQPTSRVQHFAEDRTPGSGHMQVCHRSPVTGVFEPHVKLGDNIRVGQILGIVRDLYSNAEQPIQADKTGIVVVLRTFPRVCKGDSVGVVVDTKRSSGTSGQHT